MTLFDCVCEGVCVTDADCVALADCDCEGVCVTDLDCVSVALCDCEAVTDWVWLEVRDCD